MTSDCFIYIYIPGGVLPCFGIVKNARRMLKKASKKGKIFVLNAKHYLLCIRGRRHHIQLESLSCLCFCFLSEKRRHLLDQLQDPPYASLPFNSLAAAISSAPSHKVNAANHGGINTNNSNNNTIRRNMSSAKSAPALNGVREQEKSALYFNTMMRYFHKRQPIDSATESAILRHHQRPQQQGNVPPPRGNPWFSTTPSTSATAAASPSSGAFQSVPPATKIPEWR